MSRLPSTFLPFRIRSENYSTESLVSAPASGHIDPDTIFARPLHKTRSQQSSLSALQHLLAAHSLYAQPRCDDLAALSHRAHKIGYAVGSRLAELLVNREGGKKRETKLLTALYWVHTNFCMWLFGVKADGLEKGLSGEEEYMLIFNNPIFTRSMTPSKDMGEYSPDGFLAGLVAGVLDSFGFRCNTSAHKTATAALPRRTTILIRMVNEESVT